MPNDLEQLPRLIQQAIATLNKATTAAEILEAGTQADVAYSAAKKAAQLAKIKGAHDTVVVACHKIMGDALMIEAQAQCRLADEYDAAQDRGEVKGAGQPRKSNVSKENNTPSVTDIGLTRTQVHEARRVRDAEKTKPGIVRKTVEEKLQAGVEPTRADVKRAVQGDRAKNSGRRKTKKQTDNLETKIVALDAKGMSSPEIAAELGIEGRAVRHALEDERIRQEAKAEPDIDRAELAMSAQQKFDAASRQHQRKLDLAFEQRVSDEIRKRLDEIVLPHWRQKIEEAKTLYARRKSIMDKQTFDAIRRGLHPDSRNSISDKKLGDAFDAFMRLEKLLLNEKDSPTDLPDLPSTYEGWLKMRRPRSAKQSRSNIRPR